MKTVLQANSATVVFTPGPAGAGTLDFSPLFQKQNFDISRLLAIINQTRNTIIYAEAQAGLGWTSWNRFTHILTLASDTSNQANTDILQFIYDTPAVQTIPSEEYIDPVNKSRVSTPQSLIDTDFEYGIQSTKWELLYLLNNKPAVYYEPIIPFDQNSITGITTIAGSREVTVNFTSSGANTVSAMNIGPIFVQDTLVSDANGFYAISALRAFPGPGGNFTYVARAPMPQTTAGTGIMEPNRTLIYPCSLYTGSGIPLATTNAFTYVGRTVTCTTSQAHGLYTGQNIYVFNTTMQPAVGLPSGTPSGSWTVRETPNATQFTFDVLNQPVGTISNSIGSTNLYPRPAGYAIHRPYDGGVQMSTGGGAPNVTTIRQTRRYFRYQSGKGVQFSTGSIFRPAFQLNALSAESLTLNATISAFSKVPHGMQPGAEITVAGATDPAYNGVFYINSVPNDLTLTYSTTGTPSMLTAEGLPQLVSPGRGWGCTTRLGLFDSQNGIFFEHDGQWTYAVRRSSVTQLQGLVNLTQNSNVVTGNNTVFANQLVPGDFITIKGMPYRILSIASHREMYVSPEYRGPSVNNTIYSKVVETRIRQDQWNIDPMDGSGPSGYVLDPTRMQMCYIDYSWYGAGFIRWGFRSNDGNVYFCHKMLNNNVNPEAYMRSGNLPARYEENTICPSTITTATLTNGGTTLNVVDTTTFPPSGTLRVTNPGNTSSATIEYIRYRGKTNTTFNNLIRAEPGGNSTAQNFPWVDTAPTQVELVGVTGPNGARSNVPSAYAISHWGSSVIMDGRYDDDLNVVFNAGAPQSLNIARNNRNAIISIRLSPSVDNGRIGLLGVRDVINRMQLRLRSMDICVPNFGAIPAANTVTLGAYRVEVLLNCRHSNPTQWINVGGSSLAQVAYHPVGTLVEGGELVFGFFHTGGSGFQDLTPVRELGNCVLGGGLTNTVATIGRPGPSGGGLVTNIIPGNNAGMYPDGPDVLTIVVTNITPTQGGVTPAGSTSEVIQSRISWTEAQA